MVKELLQIKIIIPNVNMGLKNTENGIHMSTYTLFFLLFNTRTNYMIPRRNTL